MRHSPTKCHCGGRTRHTRTAGYVSRSQTRDRPQRTPQRPDQQPLPPRPIHPASPKGATAITDDTGAPITDAEVLDRVERIGSVVVHRGPVERLDFPTWRRELRRGARERGLRLSVRQLDGMNLVSNLDHVVTEDQIRRAVETCRCRPNSKRSHAAGACTSSATVTTSPHSTAAARSRPADPAPVKQAGSDAAGERRECSLPDRK